MQQAHPEQQRKHRDQLGAGRGLPGAGRGVMAVPGDGLEDDFSDNLWYSVKDIKKAAGNASWRRENCMLMRTAITTSSLARPDAAGRCAVASSSGRGRG